jgi:hypothetical protein
LLVTPKLIVVAENITRCGNVRTTWLIEIRGRDRTVSIDRTLAGIKYSRCYKHVTIDKSNAVALNKATNQEGEERRKEERCVRSI